MKQLSKQSQINLAELNKFSRTQAASIQSVEGSYTEKLHEIRELRKQLNAALDELENTTLKELDEIRYILQTTLKENADNCSRLKKELQQISKEVQGLCDESNKELEFIASRKCLNKIQESESYLKENPVKVQSPMILQANIDIQQYLSTQSSLGRIVYNMPSLTLKMIQDQVLTVKRKSEYNVEKSADKAWTCLITGICRMRSGQVIVVDYNNENVKLLDPHYNVSSHCDVFGTPCDICQITSSEVAVTLYDARVQFLFGAMGSL
ncbi:hypothetical protein DPMN_037044 [Dreissena polymorpha]|uniref:Uncharacterized protein n=2 Tax=Dreissena polymorpha TaxID=45954 RepID=A0A9D4MDQ9_DREPO|nr:hypothetical protein DPMN_037044 [Dreissena polymorpha]